MKDLRLFLFLLAAMVQSCEFVRESDKCRAKCLETAKRLDGQQNNRLHFLKQLQPKERTRYIVDAQNGKEDYYLKNYNMRLFAKPSVVIPQMIASYLQPREMHQMKSTTKNLNNLKITGKLNLFPNESSVQVFRVLEARNGIHEITWEDPHNLISNLKRDDLERCLALAGDALDALSVKISAEGLVDEVSKWENPRPFYPFFKKILRNVLHREGISPEKRKTCKKLLMREAIVSNTPEDVTWLISRKRNMNSRIVDDRVSLEEPIFPGNVCNLKPLMLAVSYDHYNKNYFDIAKILLQAGAEPNSEQNFGRMAIQDAANHESLDIMKLLLDYNADVNPHGLSKWMQVPLFSACYDAEKVKLLVDAGANVNAENDDHVTPLMWSTIYTGKFESVAVLIQRGAKLNARDKNGRTALMWASEFGNVEAVKLLLTAGANSQYSNRKGTAAEIAQEKGHQNCADLINDYLTALN